MDIEAVLIHQLRQELEEITRRLEVIEGRLLKIEEARR